MQPKVGRLSSVLDKLPEMKYLKRSKMVFTVARECGVLGGSPWSFLPVGESEGSLKAGVLKTF